MRTIDSAWHELISRHRKQEGVVGLQTAIDGLIDESNSAFKLLLPDLSGANVLYVGCDTSGTAANLARTCQSVVALFVSEQSYRTQQAKSQLQKGSPNLHLLYLERTRLSFPDAAFDGVVVDCALEGIGPGAVKSESGAGNLAARQSELLREISRVVKPAGWIFLKCRNRLRRSAFLETVKSGKAVWRKVFSPSAIKWQGIGGRQSHSLSFSDCRKQLGDAGFIPRQLYAFDELNLGVDRIVELDCPGQIRQLTKHGKLRYLPLWLYRLTAPSVGMLAGKEALPASILSDIIAKVKADVAAGDDFNIGSIEINRKGKFVVMLNVNRQMRRRLMLKIPLTHNAEQHMRHNYSGLDAIRQAFDGLKNVGGPQLVFPEPVCAGQYKNVEYYVESCVPGRPFRKSKSDQKMSGIVEQVEAAVVAFQHIQCHQDMLLNRISLQQQIHFIREFILHDNPEMLERFDRISQPILREELEFKGACYFFKSDFSVNNTFVKNGVLKGMIDFDFWGVSHNKLVDYADFVFSFLRTFYGHSYADALALISSSRLSSIGPYLNVEKTIKALGGSEREFKSAARIAWINSVCHILEFERTRLNSKRMELVLFNPIKKLAELDDAENL